MSKPRRLSPPPARGRSVCEADRVGVSWFAIPTRPSAPADLPFSRGGEARNVKRFSDARLHAVSSKNMYSEHGFDARMSPPFGQVCQSLIVVWNWMPGSAEAQAA